MSSHKSGRKIINVFLEEDQQVERSISFKTRGSDFSRLICYQANDFQTIFSNHEKCIFIPKICCIPVKQDSLCFALIGDIVHFSSEQLLC